MSSEPRWDDRGLVPAIVQDVDTRRVLMLGYMNAEALERTRRSGEVWFWSRSRSELWHKGATSGNRLRVVDLVWDCDTDAVLVSVRPTGPTCHTGSVSCFRPAGTPDDDQGAARLEDLWRVVVERRRTMPAGSYTAALLADEPDATARKVVEEATEVLIAAKDHATGRADGRRLAEEAADLLYHLWVLLAGRDVPLRDVLDVLDSRADRLRHGGRPDTVESEGPPP